ncbi:hypothetical protein GGS21DRAFT_487041 [Xylaria nigripes]|nr:hypothetical protein GGS21DRAFT_487041 [Xylaria nigripes]
MHRVLSSRWINNALNVAERPAGLELPVFLCPAAVRIKGSYVPRLSSPVPSRLRGVPWQTQIRCLHIEAEPLTTLVASSDPVLNAPSPNKKTLPKQCRGCGALSQTSRPNQAGYFDLSRKAVQKYLGLDERPESHRSEHSLREEEFYKEVLSTLDPEALEKQGVDVQALGFGPAPVENRPQAPPKKPLCDRCHYLIHNHTGESIYHPSIESIHDTLLESPYKYNHVYHVLDAADFPMSLLPKISDFLDTMPLRSKNRRSRSGRFYHGQKTEISFIITRADLLAPTKPQVDTLFPYLREVLREKLGRLGQNIRLGNLKAVSAKRGWWTKELKEDIWGRGGGGWLVGKANVGKSKLFEAVFPKGRMDWDPSKHQITIDMEAKKMSALPVEKNLDDIADDSFDQYSLLPPAPKETQYPEMPLVSDLPGTTASPIRVPFGNGRGELIDLPGLNRTGLDQHVQKEHRLSLLMQSRTVPEQMTVKPGQSLLLGGFIRITPRDPNLVILTYAFTPIKPHVCRTDKAISIQNHMGEVNVENIAVPGTGDKTKLAGSFQLRWDVTKQRTGPLTRKDAIHLDVERLPYRVVSADILIEGVGWLEIVAQVRTRDLFKWRPPVEEEQQVDPEQSDRISTVEQFEALAEEPQGKKIQQVEPKQSDRVMTIEQFEALADGPRGNMEHKRSPPPVQTPQTLDGEPNWPIVDVYSPEGKYISCRQPMNGWMLNKPLITAASRRSRPRKSMKGAKKTEKKRRREQEAAYN